MTEIKIGGFTIFYEKFPNGDWDQERLSIKINDDGGCIAFNPHQLEISQFPQVRGHMGAGGVIAFATLETPIPAVVESVGAIADILGE